MKRIQTLSILLTSLFALCFGGAAFAACKDAVLLVHGNTASPSSWNNTYNHLRGKGYGTSEIIRPSWGSKSCAACNDHVGGELTTVKNAVNTAISRSCTGKIDVVGHSMGVTLAAKAILDMGKNGKVDSFVGVAGAWRGLNSCGTYPWNVPSTTCGKWGLSKNSYTMNQLKYKRMGSRRYSIKSYYDQVVCYGSCYVGGTHTSNLYGQNGTNTYNYYGHFNLQKYTYSQQYNRIK